MAGSTQAVYLMQVEEGVSFVAKTLLQTGGPGPGGIERPDVQVSVADRLAVPSLGADPVGLVPGLPPAVPVVPDRFVGRPAGELIEPSSGHVSPTHAASMTPQLVAAQQRQTGHITPLPKRFAGRQSGVAIVGTSGAGVVDDAPEPGQLQGAEAVRRPPLRSFQAAGDVEGGPAQQPLLLTPKPRDIARRRPRARTDAVRRVQSGGPDVDRDGGHDCSSALPAGRPQPATGCPTWPWRTAVCHPSPATPR